MAFMKFWFVYILVFLSVAGHIQAQDDFVMNGNRSRKIPFKLINNVIVLPVEVNGVALSFLLDTGVSKPIVFNILNLEDSLQVKKSEKILLRGLGEGDHVEALRSRGNVFKIGEVFNINQELFIVHNQILNFEPRLGVPIHGIIGYDVFRDFVVQINYGKKYIRFYKPDNFEPKPCKRCAELDLEFYRNKPYLRGEVAIGSQEVPVKLLIDTGGSDALWLFEDENLGLVPDQPYFKDFLGHGLSGSVYGKRSKIAAFTLGEFTFHHANVSFPEASSISYVREHKTRNGSVAGHILKRFNLYVDYPRKRLYLKKNRYYNEPFRYNRSGIELEKNGFMLVVGDQGSKAGEGLALKPAFMVVELRENSPAQQAGVKIGDVVLSVNDKASSEFTLQEITHKFYGDNGKKIRLVLDRDGQIIKIAFRLKSFFKE